MAEPYRVLSTWCRVTLVERLKQRASERDMTLRAAVEEAIELWLAQDAPPAEH